MLINRRIAALIAGLLFGLGLNVSRMVDPAKVQSFLDVAGDWDPGLAAVMAAALLFTVPAYRVIFSRGKPLFDQRFYLPGVKSVDIRLVAGASLFGLGWALIGFCPGPAIAGLGYGDWRAAVFVGAMLAGIGLHRAFKAFLARPQGSAGKQAAN